LEANWIGHILRGNCLLKQSIEGKIKGWIEVTGRRGRRRRKLLDDLKYRREYSHLKEEPLDCLMWKGRFGWGLGPVVRETAKWMSLCSIMGSSKFSDYDRSYRLQFSPIIYVSVINFMSINILSLHCLNKNQRISVKKITHPYVLKPVLRVIYSEKSNLEPRLMWYMTKMPKNFITLGVKAETLWWYQFSRETYFRHLDRCYFRQSRNIYDNYISSNLWFVCSNTGLEFASVLKI
jgi:hypothetical protein